MNPRLRGSNGPKSAFADSREWRRGALRVPFQPDRSLNLHSIGIAALACSLALCPRPGAAQDGEVPDTVGNFGVFHQPAPSLDENHDMAIVASSDRDRMSAVSWRCMGRRTLVEVALDRSEGFTGTEARLVYRFGQDPPHGTVARRLNDRGMLFSIPPGEAYAFSMRAKRARRLTVRAFADGGRVREYIFDLTGSASALASLPCSATPRPPHS
jgi:hypothetical protein